MFWIIATIVLVGGAVGAWVFAGGYTYTDPAYRGFTRIGAGVALAVWLIITFFAMVVTVDSGKVTIIRQFGEIVGQADAGVNFILPWQSAADEVSIRTETRTF